MIETLRAPYRAKSAAHAFAPFLSAALHALYDPTVREDLPREWLSLIAAADARTPGAAAPGPEPETMGDGSRPLRILLVEDDGLVRMTTAGILVELGHRVDEAGDGEAALAVMDDSAIDLLITDVALPGCSGVELARRAAERDPTLLIIFATGVRPDALGDAPPARCCFLAKPYGERDLRRALAEVTRL